MKRDLKVYGNIYNHFKSDPFIILKGKWLRNTGFDIGDHIQVEYQEDRIIITKK